MEYVYDGSLDGLFALLAQSLRYDDEPGPVRRTASRSGGKTEAQGGLFDESGGYAPLAGGTSSLSAVITQYRAQQYSADALFEASADAFSAFVHAWMSELPVDEAILRYGWRVLKAAEKHPEGSEEARLAAETAAHELASAESLAVHRAAYKSRREIDRLYGLLRFSPARGGVYTARCAPDGFVLPALANHFAMRFGSTPWAVIDEKRGLILRCVNDEPVLDPLEAEAAAQDYAPVAHNDEFTALWKDYYKATTNESRLNPALRLQFMPRRYWKYLTELER